MDENPVGKRPLRRSRLRWEDMIKKDVFALMMDWIGKHELWIEKAGELDV